MKFLEVLPDFLDKSSGQSIRRKCWKVGARLENHHDYGFYLRWKAIPAYEIERKYPLSGEDLRAGDWEYYDERVKLETIGVGEKFSFCNDSQIHQVVKVTCWRETTSADRMDIFHLKLDDYSVTHSIHNILVYRR